MILRYLDLDIMPLRRFTLEMSRQHILRACEICATKKIAAKRLGISVGCLYRILQATRPDPEPKPLEEFEFEVPIAFCKSEPRISCKPHRKPKAQKPIEIPSDGCTITSLLDLFCVVPDRGVRNFWSVHSSQELEWYLRDARQTYLRLVKSLHPDVNADPQAGCRMADLNRSWDRICYLFKQHGIES